MARRVVQRGAADGDRISQLPAEILDHIMGFLPIQEAAKLALLSKVWRDVWSRLTQLCFDHHFFHYVGMKYSNEACNDIKERSCVHVITQILLQHKGSIRKFVCIHVPAIRNTGRSPPLDVDDWLRLVTQKGVEEIHLHFGHDKDNPEKLPDCIFSCSTLKTLRLNGFSVDPRRSPYTLPNATSLCLDYADFGTGHLRNFAVHLPRLENLSISWCQDMFRFDITARNLTSLTIYGCCSTRPRKFLPDNLDMKSLSTLEIDYYSLRYFARQYCTKRPSLRMPALNVELLKLSNFCSQEDDEISAFLCLLSNCPKLRNLEIGLKWAGDINKCVDGKFGNLEKFRSVLRTHVELLFLKLSSFGGSRPQMLFVKETLAWLPALEKVVIIHFPYMFDWNEEHETMEAISRFPCASANAKIVYQ